MNYYKLLEEKLNITIEQDYKLSAYDLEVSTYYTADNYDIYVMTNEPSNIDWENDVYYYEPSFEEIIDRIKETAENESYDGDPAVVWLADFDQYLPEGEVQDYLEELNDKNND